MKCKNILPAVLMGFVLSLGVVSFAMAEENGKRAEAAAVDRDKIFIEENHVDDENERNRDIITATPVITIAEPKEQYGIYDIIVVEIKAEKGFDVYYTLDGTDPLTDGILYENSFEIPAPEENRVIILRAIAVKHWAEEEVIPYYGNSEEITEEHGEEINVETDENTDEEIIREETGEEQFMEEVLEDEINSRENEDENDCKEDIEDEESEVIIFSEEGSAAIQ